MNCSAEVYIRYTVAACKINYAYIWSKENNTPAASLAFM